MVYKLVCDLAELDLNKFSNAMEERGIDICLSDEEIYLYSPYNKKVSFDIKMKKILNSNYFLKVITEKPREEANGFIYKWIRSKMEADEVANFEATKQEELRVMMDNIEKAQELLRVQLLQKKEVEDGSISGNSPQEARTGKTEENSD